MTPRVAGLGDMPAITAGFRPFRPAPTAAGPGDPPPGTPSGPWHPRHGEKACGCGVLDGEDCDCAEFAAQARTAARRPIFFDFRKQVA